MQSIPFLDILYVITYLATILGFSTELLRKRVKSAWRVLVVGVIALVLELLIVGVLLYHWPVDKLVFRYVTHGHQLVPYLIHEYF